MQIRLAKKEAFGKVTPRSQFYRFRFATMPTWKSVVDFIYFHVGSMQKNFLRHGDVDDSKVCGLDVVRILNYEEPENSAELDLWVSKHAWSDRVGCRLLGLHFQMTSSYDNVWVWRPVSPQPLTVDSIWHEIRILHPKFTLGCYFCDDAAPETSWGTSRRIRFELEYVVKSGISDISIKISIKITNISILRDDPHGVSEGAPSQKYLPGVNLGCRIRIWCQNQPTVNGWGPTGRQTQTRS